MKIAIIAFSNLEYLPYATRYINKLDEMKIDYDVIYWSRDDLGKNDDRKDNYISFNKKSDLNKNKMSKVKDFLEFRYFTKKIIKKNKYDKLIILSTLPGILLMDLLTKNYSNKFILDIRDPSYERFFIFNAALKRIVKNSIIVPISSPGFLEFLPKIENKYKVVHNFNKNNISNINFEKKILKNEKLKIGFFGFLRHEKINFQLIDSIKNDSRFELHYYGFMKNELGEKIKNYVEQEEINNIYFHGFYNESEKKILMEEIDIVHNLYENNLTRYSLGNKLYDGALYKKPQLVTGGSIMGEMVDNYRLGLVINENEISTKEIFEWYNKLDSKDFTNNCDYFLEYVLMEDTRFDHLLSNALK